MNITLEDVKAADEKVKNARAELAKMLLDFARQECPLQVGEVVVNPGITHKGKKIRVDRVLAPKYVSSYQGNWVVEGLIFNKDGKLGKVSTTFTEREWNQRD
jgi:hypothetical protein